MALIIKNGIIGSPAGAFRGDLLIEGEKIAAVGSSLHAAAAGVFDARGRYVLPGGVDPHTHVMLKIGARKVSDGFKAATRAALFGGTTTIVDHPGFAPDGSPLAAPVELELEEGAKGSFTDYAVHMVFQRYDETVRRELHDVIAKGFPTGKVYTTYAGMLRDEEIFPLMKQMKEEGGLLFFHCENNAVTSGLGAEYQKTLPTPYDAWPKSRPDYCEAEAVKRVLTLARAAEVPVYIVHLSTKAALEEVILARRTGQTVYAESCPQYLLLTDDRYKQENGLDYVMAPPLRGRGDCERLWRAAAQGDIDTIGTDHCSFSRAVKKRLGARNIFNAPGGVPGVETRMELLFSEGVMKGRLSLERFVEITAAAPARILGMPDKGRLEAGADADVIIIDPEQPHTVTCGALHQKADYTPYEGAALSCRCTDVWLRGEHLVADGELKEKKPKGRFIKRSL
ncbi:MAG: dihydropyrimidinase [Cloacibacillus sp.]